MSLRVWLPLNGNLDNQGLDQVTVTNNGAIVDNNGKIGKCYSFGTGNSYIVIDSTPLKTFTEFSFACWIKIISWNTSYSTVFAAKNSTAVSWNNLIFSLLRSGSTSSLCFNISNGTSYTSTNCYTGTLSINTWYHIVCTYEEGKIKLYQDGNIINTYNTTIIPNFNSIVNLWIGKSNENSYQSNNLLNDVRIYDHALSPLEVKQISQGLILHYPLSDAYVEGTTNLSNSKLSSSCYNAVTQKYSYGTNTDIYKEFGTFEGRACEKVHMGTNGLDAFPYVFFDYFQPPIGETRTLSFDYYPTIMDKVVFYTYNSPGSGNYTVNYKTPVSWSGSVTIPVQLNQWNHITITVTNTGSAASGYGYMQIGNVKHTSNTANYWLFGNIQVEAKDHATGYVGPNGTRNTSIIYDCSGFCNNGIAFGTFIVSNNTPKYNVSTVFNGTNNAIQTPSLPSMISDKNYTIAVWIYKTVIGSKGYQTIYGGPSGFEIEARNGGANETKFVPWNWGKPMASYELNEWNHCVFVHSDSDCKIYLNGEYIATGTAKSANPTGNYFVGAWNTATQQNFDGLMSDFRIYVTALSAEDVKSLYNNSAYIDNQGNIYGAVYEEV